MKIICTNNINKWEQFKEAKGTEEKKKILDEMMDSQKIKKEENKNLTPQQIEIKK